MMPPWQNFPTYERYTIGWRMGTGEDYLHNWRRFLKTVPVDYSKRLNYLRQHKPAPFSWGDVVLEVLYPHQKRDAFGCSDSEIKQLQELGLVEADSAYNIWRHQQTELVFPWSFSVDITPEEAARYHTREFWFFSRYLKENRDQVRLVNIPSAWQSLQTPLETGQLADISTTETKEGLFTLAKMLCAGDIQPPWHLGLTSDDFKDSFELDMGYTDAYQLWMMSAFDDDRLFNEMLAKYAIPNNWTDWISEHAHFS